MVVKKCCNCGADLINYEYVDTEWYGDTYYDTVTTDCPQCNKTYMWTDVYRLHESIDFKEIKRGE